MKACMLLITILCLSLKPAFVEGGKCARCNIRGGTNDVYTGPGANNGLTNKQYCESLRDDRTPPVEYFNADGTTYNLPVGFQHCYWDDVKERCRETEFGGVGHVDRDQCRQGLCLMPCSGCNKRTPFDNRHDCEHEHNYCAWDACAPVGKRCGLCAYDNQLDCDNVKHNGQRSKAADTCGGTGHQHQHSSIGAGTAWSCDPSTGSPPAGTGVYLATRPCYWDYCDKKCRDNDDDYLFEKNGSPLVDKDALCYDSSVSVTCPDHLCPQDAEEDVECNDVCGSETVDRDGKNDPPGEDVYCAARRAIHPLCFWR